MLYFKGEVILRLVFDGVKTVTKLCPALSYWEGGGRSTMWVTTRVIGAKPFSKGKDATMTKFPILVKTAQKVKHPIIPPIMPLRPYEEMVG